MKQSRKVGKKARALFHKQNGLCHYCKVNMTLKRGNAAMVTIDHVHPKSQGGTRHNNNVVGACFACNNAKGDRHYEDFMAEVKRNGRPDNKPNDFTDIRVQRAAKDKPILVSNAPWKTTKLAARPYLDTVGKHNILADALIAAGLAKKEQA